MGYSQVGKRQKQRLCENQACEIILRNRQVEDELRVLDRYENEKREIQLISTDFLFILCWLLKVAYKVLGFIVEVLYILCACRPLLSFLASWAPSFLLLHPQLCFFCFHVTCLQLGLFSCPSSCKIFTPPMAPF